MQLAPRLLLVVIGIAAAGCDSSAGTAAPSPAASSSSVPAAAPSAALKAAPPKAFAPAEETSIGTLPAGVGIPVGAEAPDFELEGADGKKVSLSGLLKKTRVLLVFYRGGW